MTFLEKVNQIESLTFKIIADLKVKKLPIPIHKIVKKFSLALAQLDMTEEEASGILVIANGKGTIGYNPNDPEVRQRFTISHELGHFLLHKNSSELFVDRDFIVKYRNTKNSYTHTELRQEQEANAFAAALLMPKEFIDEKLSKKEYLDLSETKLIERLAREFKVSTAAMTYRLSNLNNNYLD